MGGSNSPAFCFKAAELPVTPPFQSRLFYRILVSTSLRLAEFAVEGPVIPIVDNWSLLRYYIQIVRYRTSKGIR
jgi:hypothetical protein